MNFWNLETYGSNLNTINITSSPLSISNNLTLNAGGGTTFTGASGWTCANLLSSALSSNIILQNSITYTTTTSVNMLGANAQRITMRSNAAGARAIWTFNGNNQSMVYVNPLRIDSSLGQTIWSFAAVIDTTPPAEATQNWNPGTKPETQGITFVN